MGNIFKLGCNVNKLISESAKEIVSQANDRYGAYKEAAETLPKWSNVAAKNLDKYSVDMISSFREDHKFVNEIYNLGASFFYATNMPIPMPVYLKTAGELDGWKFPLDPAISIVGKNSIMAKSIARNSGRGTVKERWAQDDYTITMTGVLMQAKSEGKGNVQYPYVDVNLLRHYFEAKREIIVLCPLLDMFNIHHMVIKELSLPFTKYGAVQQYTITALSDAPCKLLITPGDKTAGEAEKKYKELTKAIEDLAK